MWEVKGRECGYFNKILSVNQYWVGWSDGQGGWTWECYEGKISGSEVTAVVAGDWIVGGATVSRSRMMRM